MQNEEKTNWVQEWLSVIKPLPRWTFKLWCGIVLMPLILTWIAWE